MYVLDMVNKDVSDIKKLAHFYSYLSSIDEERAKDILRGAKSYVRDNNISAYNDLVNISYGHNDCGAGWNPKEAAAIVLFWEAQNVIDYNR